MKTPNLATIIRFILGIKLRGEAEIIGRMEHLQ